MWVREDSQEQGPGDGLGFLVTSSLVLLFLEMYRKDGSEEWSWLCPSLETEVIVTWQKSKASIDCGECEPKIFLCWVFLFIIFVLSFLPPAEGVTAQPLPGWADTHWALLENVPSSPGLWRWAAPNGGWWMPLSCWGNSCVYRGIRTGRRSWTCPHSEHTVAARCNHNVLFSADLKATLPYHLPEY